MPADAQDSLNVAGQQRHGGGIFLINAPPATLSTPHRRRGIQSWLAFLIFFFFTSFSCLLLHHTSNCCAAFVILIVLLHAKVVLCPTRAKGQRIIAAAEFSAEIYLGIKRKHILREQSGQPREGEKSCLWVYMHSLLSAPLRLQMCNTAMSRPHCSLLI